MIRRIPIPLYVFLLSVKRGLNIETNRSSHFFMKHATNAKSDDERVMAKLEY